MRVLYVEDNPADAELTRLTLARIAPALELEIVGTVAEAVRRLDAGVDRDAALVDLRLSDGDGLAVLAHARLRGLPLAVVIVTGAGDEETAVSVLKAGADDYVAKRPDYLASLPLVLEDAVARRRAGSGRHVSRLRVLYVEHNPADVDLAVRHLARHAPHIALDVATTAEEGLRLLRAMPPDAVPWDVVLLDYNLPGTNALEMLQEMRYAGLGGLPVVLVTGRGHEDLALQALRLGAADYLPKGAGYLFRLPGVLESAWHKTRLAGEREALRQSEERFRLLAELAEDLIYRYRFVPTRGFEYVSPSATAITGYTPEDHYADPDLGFKLVHPDDRHLLEEAGREGAASTITLRWVRKDGTTIWTEQRNVLVRDSAGAVVALQGVARDVTERRRAAEKLAQAQKMEVVGRLTAGVAHDFNNLLTAINGFTEFAQRRLEAAHPVRELLDKVLEAGQRAAVLVGQLLAFSRKRTAEPGFVEVSTLLAGLERMLRRVIGEDIEVAIAGGRGSPRVFMDPLHLEHAILNLAVNARDAMPAGGRLAIAAAEEVLDGAGAAACGLAAGTYVALAVSDTGTGMSDEVKAHLFEPFFTTKDVGRGTGLGLATVLDVVRQAGGGVRVMSEPGRGTTVTLLLPRAVAPGTAAAPASARADEAAPARGSERVLLVEDDPGVRAVVLEMLGDLGYEVVEAHSAAEALERAAAGPPVRLLLSDVVMPGVNGPTLAAELRRRMPGLKVLLMSGYSEEVLARQAAPSGVVPVLRKPFSLAELASRVRAALDGP